MAGATRVKFVGPIFHAEIAQEIISQYIDRVLDRLAEVAVDDIQNRLDDVLVNPTGFYRSQIMSTNAVRSRIITDSNVIYGPWLEGVGSRNAPVTRFKGYATFRYVTQGLKAKAGPYAEGVLRNGFLGELNGEGVGAGVRGFM